MISRFTWLLSICPQKIHRCNCCIQNCPLHESWVPVNYTSTSLISDNICLWLLQMKLSQQNILFFLSVSFSFSCFQNERENHNSLQHMLVTLLGTLKFSSVWKLALLIFYGVCHSCFYQNWLELLLCGLIVLTESHPWLRGRYKDW